ncbi:Predicted O-linked N-acetylglucosamine transferase, SPINDLY family [Methylophilus rhizosphaerae]|uniref:protein O-GlcNAc transferase n=1 Tax=Methylophilus rhizosphaerae TaxID=492660 RepID=A0A1G8ZDD8_9PROT|nr:tetratricopeptide repeat protein [Methylophilus rhizosphaerae]SDK13037.1 Predicted O-linked N-acetylglucosamine transferase, SPINDLY family [Methylophilus rhizosphaerae]
MRPSSASLPSAASPEKDSPYWMEQLIQAWQQGEWAQCMSLAQKITTDFPREGLAWKLLGSLYQQQGDLAAAADAFSQAGKLLKKDAEVFYNLANVYAQQEDHSQAIKYYQQTIKLNPGFSRAYANWAGELKQTGQLQEAEKLLRRGLKVQQQDGRVNFELATLLHEADKPLEAIQYYREAAGLEPQNAVVFFNMAVALALLDNESEAIQAYETAIALQADYVEAYGHLGALYLEKENFNEAEQWLLAGYAIQPQALSVLKGLAKLYRVTQRPREYQQYLDQILRLEDFSAESLNSFATEMINQHLYSQAESCCLKAMEKDPDNPYVLANMGLIEGTRQEYDKACHYYEQALQQLPDAKVIVSNYSVILRQLERFDEAITCLEKVLNSHPEFIGGYVNLANIYLDMGQVEKAIEILKQALAVEPGDAMTLTNLLFCNSYVNTLSHDESLEYARQLGTSIMQHVLPYDSWHVHAQEQRIRIGVVSADLRKHPVGYFLHQWLQKFDASRLEIYGYSTDGCEDAFSHELKALCNQWCSLAGLTDAQAAKQIREDGIHILLDLSGLTRGNRLPIFAHRPAPVQATWLGYWGTTGLPAMDYVIADPVSIDRQVAAQFTEQVEYLPHTRMCFAIPDYDVAVNDLPALATGAVTFGCFQKYSKVNDDVLACWGEILQALPSARLYWQTRAFNDAKVRAEAFTWLQRHGIAAERCTLAGGVSRGEYLKNHHQIDMILDTFPFTGGTTTCEALWMGVPTLTVLGDTLIARQGASFMTCTGLPEWVATSREDYIRKAIAFGRDLDALATLRASLRAQVIASPLMNGGQFAHDFEQLLFSLWQQALTKLKPEQCLAETPVQAAFAGDTPVWVVSATRMDEATFWRESALGRSLTRHMQQDARLVAKVACENTRGLSEIFNEAIAAAPDNALLVFIHDDVWIDENTFVQSVSNGLQQYDVIGVAGNARLQPGQPAWCFVDTRFTWDDPVYLRGTVGHGQYAFGPVSAYGKPSGSAQLMDGVFLAAYKQRLVQANVTFDPQFDFHFYDLDFCRTATQAGLQLGVWPVRLTHQSGGAFGTQRWREKYQQYARKWEAAQQAPSAALLESIAEVFDLAVAQQQQGQSQAARALYQEILQIHPQHALSLHNLGLMAWNEQQQTQAIALFEQAYGLESEQWQLLSSYVNALEMAKHPQLQTVLAQALQRGHHTQALQSLMASWGINDSATEQLMNALEAEEAALLALFEQAAYAEMQQRLEALLHQHADWLNGWKMLSDVRMLLKEDAREPARHALDLNQNDPKEHCYYGLVLKAQGDLRGAAKAFEQAIALKPDYAAAYNNLGIVLKDLGDVPAAISHFRQALALQPADAGCFSNLLFCMSHAQEVDTATLLQSHLAYAERYETPLKAGWQPHANIRDPDRRLRIGIVSADFRAHSVAHFLQPLLPGLASDPQLALYAYYNHPVSDTVTADMRQYFAGWKEVSALSDEALAATIRQDEIDILIDLSGHTSGNRLLAFARKPAPVQISWLGYLNTTGLAAMDYYLADAALAPAGELDGQFTEKLVQLPVNAPFVPDANMPDVQALPALNNGYITFGCFNRPNKITQATVQLWAQLMQAVPDSRMLLGGMAATDNDAHLLAWFDAAGITADRVELVARSDMADYLQQYHRVDICLDTFPSNGVTTTAHALWMGVPTLCLAGDRLSSRGAMALMQHAGLPAWIAANHQAWIEQGKSLCADLAALAALHNGMRDRLQQSLLSQPARLSASLAEALRNMWYRWCQNQSPESFNINLLAGDEALIAPTANQIITKGPYMETLAIDQDSAGQQALEQSIEEVLQLAIKHQEQGELAPAAALYQEILSISPKHHVAYYGLGLISLPESAKAALPLLEQAVILAPQTEEYWTAYVHALMQTTHQQEVTEVIEFSRQHGLPEAAVQRLQQICAAYYAEVATPAVENTKAVTVGGYIYRPQDNFYQRAQAEAFGYQDAGNAEQRLYDIIRQSRDRSVFSDELSAKATDWPSYYHLTSQRANLLRPFSEKIASGKVLELGAGCGAVTRFLGELGGQVVAVEGSPNRARIIGQRCAELQNVSVFCDLIQSYETDEKFDVVTLIGVLEYAQVYVKEANPLLALLQKAKSFLKEDGMLIVAIENQLGLKYFCGAPEDHMGQAMYGINDSYSTTTPITFGRVELDALIRSAGFATTELYVPLPDYKTPVTVIYPEGFNPAHKAAGWDVGALAAGSVVHDRQSPRHPTFSLENAWQVLARNHLVEDMANSFMFVAYPAQQAGKQHSDVLAAHYGCQRQAVFSKETQFVHADNTLSTRTRNTGETAKLLQADWEPSPYHGGTLWMDKLTQLVNRPGWRVEDLTAWASVWVKALEANVTKGGHTLPEFAGATTLLPSQYFDATPTNFVVDAQGQGNFFDLEWDFAIPLPVSFVALRGLFLTLHRIRGCAKPHPQTPSDIGGLSLAVLEQLGYSYQDHELQAFISVFNRLQNLIQGLPEQHVNGLTSEFSRAGLPVRQLFT